MKSLKSLWFDFFSIIQFFWYQCYLIENRSQFRLKLKCCSSFWIKTAETLHIISDSMIKIIRWNSELDSLHRVIKDKFSGIKCYLVLAGNHFRKIWWSLLNSSYYGKVIVFFFVSFCPAYLRKVIQNKATLKTKKFIFRKENTRSLSFKKRI